jgi:GAF domain-containing protein
MNESGQTNYRLLAAQAEGLLSGQQHVIANAANLSALIYQELAEVNWVGFYFVESDKLVLGPFQGKPACVNIPLGQGVCGTAAAEQKIQRVANVHQFEGHIVCDTASVSELVVPLIHEGVVFGVLDLDAPVANRFSDTDEQGIARLAEIYVQSVSKALSG